MVRRFRLARAKRALEAIPWFRLVAASEGKAQAAVLMGPAKGQPVLVGQGMQIDRAQPVFSDTAEISGFIKHQCP